MKQWNPNGRQTDKQTQFCILISVTHYSHFIHKSNLTRLSRVPCFMIERQISSVLSYLSHPLAAEPSLLFPRCFSRSELRQAWGDFSSVSCREHGKRPCLSFPVQTVWHSDGGCFLECFWYLQMKNSAWDLCLILSISWITEACTSVVVLSCCWTSMTGMQCLYKYSNFCRLWKFRMIFPLWGSI